LRALKAKELHQFGEYRSPVVLNVVFLDNADRLYYSLIRETRSPCSPDPLADCPAEETQGR
jgi:hypothetical protein